MIKPDRPPRSHGEQPKKNNSRDRMRLKLLLLLIMMRPFMESIGSKRGGIRTKQKILPMCDKK